MQDGVFEPGRIQRFFDRDLARVIFQACVGRLDDRRKHELRHPCALRGVHQRDTHRCLVRGECRSNVKDAIRPGYGVRHACGIPKIADGHFRRPGSFRRIRLRRIADQRSDFSTSLDEFRDNISRELSRRPYRKNCRRFFRHPIRLPGVDRGVKLIISFIETMRAWCES